MSEDNAQEDDKPEEQPQEAPPLSTRQVLTYIVMLDEPLIAGAEAPARRVLTVNTSGPAEAIQELEALLSYASQALAQIKQQVQQQLLGVVPATMRRMPSGIPGIGPRRVR
jgi:hypothetical protein